MSIGLNNSSKNTSLLRNILIVLSVFLHVLLVFRSFPPKVALIDKKPLIYGDLSWHFSSAMENLGFYQSVGTTYGYSPYRMAGYPFGIWNSVSKRGYETVVLLPGANPEAAFYLYFVFLILVTPLILTLALHLLKPNLNTAIKIILPIVVFQLDNTISYFWTFGNGAFPFGNALSILIVALFQKSLSGNIRPAVLAGVLLGLLAWIHTVALLPAIIGMALFVVVKRKELTARSFASMAVVVVLSILLFYPWLSKLLMYMDSRTSTNLQMVPLQANIKTAFFDLFFDRALGHKDDTRFIFHLTFLLALFGVIKVKTSENKIYFATATILAGCAYLFCYVPQLKSMQPYRFIVSATLFWIVPAVDGLAYLLGQLKELKKTHGLLLLFVALLTIPSLTPHLLGVLMREKPQAISTSYEEIKEWILSHKIPGRVLCEDTALGDLLPYLTRSEVIGGNISGQSAVPNGWAYYSDYHAFGRSWDELSAEDLDEYISLYNIRVAVLHSEKSVKLFQSLPSYRKIHTGSDYSIVELEPRPLPGLWSGVYENTIKASENKIEIANAPQGTFVINYHYLKTLKADGDVTLSKKKLSDDPVDFIEVQNPTGLKTITILNKP